MRWLNRFLAPVAACLLIAGALAGQPAAADGPDLDQGWTTDQQTRWYEGTQGSRLLPWAWFKALEQPTSEALFVDDAHMASFRYLPRTSSLGLQLPVGFVIDTQDDSDLSPSRSKLRWKSGQTSNESWVGMNCSACHTGEIKYGDHTLRIDGGPSLADFQLFIKSLNAALLATQDDPAKFQRFAGRVLGSNDSSANRSMLASALGTLIRWQSDVDRMNATPLRYGFARLDAFGNIFNRAALLTGATNPIANPSDAPTSYPFLWNTPQHDFVQWNGIAENFTTNVPGLGALDVGALGRNTGQVIGVFGDIVLKPGAGLGGYASSAHVDNLVDIEVLLTKLRPPKWPSDVFGAPDDAKAAAGKSLFSERCASCHLPLDRTDLTSRIAAKMSPLSGPPGIAPGTDPWMACNAFVFEGQTGVLEGTKAAYYKGDKLGASANMAQLLGTEVAGTLVGKKGEIVAAVARTFFHIDRGGPIIHIPSDDDRAMAGETREARKAEQLLKCLSVEDRVLGYKARPLTGIWATAPYLHNGSVPTLYDLLLPPDERPKSFDLGTREYDPADVGYVYKTNPRGENTFSFHAVDEFGSDIDGNWNTGHDYGNGTLTDADRRALVEFLKTL